jgi:pimeloyl-ACP methyl ester carboxylesterase
MRGLLIIGFWLLGLFLGALPLSACAQVEPNKTDMVSQFGFKERILTHGDRTIHYYVFGNEPTQESRLILYLQGSDPSPVFAYRNTDNGVQYTNWLPGDHTRVSPDDIYVVVEKVGFAGLFPEEIDPIPDAYHQGNSLDDRVARADAVIDALTNAHDYAAVIVYGHSEGAPVAAKLGTVNDRITRLGFWAGNALPDLFDFALQSRQAVHAGEITGAEAQAGLSEMFDYFDAVVMANPSDTTPDDFGYTNKRWASYAEPPINHLLALDIPLFVQVATEDESAPIESSYLIPLEFSRLRKDNLTYRVCPGCDHGFKRENTEGEIERQWPRIFKEFLDWTEQPKP